MVTLRVEYYIDTVSFFTLFYKMQQLHVQLLYFILNQSFFIYSISSNTNFLFSIYKKSKKKNVWQINIYRNLLIKILHQTISNFLRNFTHPSVNIILKSKKAASGNNGYFELFTSIYALARGNKLL